MGRDDFARACQHGGHLRLLAVTRSTGASPWATAGGPHYQLRLAQRRDRRIAREHFCAAREVRDNALRAVRREGHQVSDEREIPVAEIRIVIAQRGWVFVGRVSREEHEVVMRDAKNIRRWGAAQASAVWSGPKTEPYSTGGHRASAPTAGHRADRRRPEVLGEAWTLIESCVRCGHGDLCAIEVLDDRERRT